MTAEEYNNLVKQIGVLISSELDNALKEVEKDPKSEYLSVMYPKIVIMSQFFGFLRGEAFQNVRPATPGSQNDFYEMEHEIEKKVNELKEKLDFDDERVKFHIGQSQKLFNK